MAPVRNFEIRFDGSAEYIGVNVAGWGTYTARFETVRSWEGRPEADRLARWNEVHEGYGTTEEAHADALDFVALPSLAQAIIVSEWETGGGEPFSV